MPGRNPIEEKAYNEKVTKAAESFWSAFQMTENGKVKSTLLLYSFCLCCLRRVVLLFAGPVGCVDRRTACFCREFDRGAGTICGRGGHLRSDLVFIQDGKAVAAGGVSLAVFADAGLSGHPADRRQRRAGGPALYPANVRNVRVASACCGRRLVHIPVLPILEA